MHPSVPTILISCTLLSGVFAAPALDISSYSAKDVPAYPDGFPNPNADQIKALQILAQGTLPNSGLPPTISAEGATNVQLIAFNEVFESQFFASLLHNVTNNVPGFEIHDEDKRQLVLQSLTSILAVSNKSPSLVDCGACHANNPPSKKKSTPSSPTAPSRPWVPAPFNPASTFSRRRLSTTPSPLPQPSRISCSARCRTWWKSSPRTRTLR